MIRYQGAEVRVTLGADGSLRGLLTGRASYGERADGTARTVSETVALAPEDLEPLREALTALLTATRAAGLERSTTIAASRAMLAAVDAGEEV